MQDSAANHDYVGAVLRRFLADSGCHLTCRNTNWGVESGRTFQCLHLDSSLLPHFYFKLHGERPAHPLVRRGNDMDHTQLGFGILGKLARPTEDSEAAF